MPGYRGRLIWPFVARIRPLDAAATDASVPTNDGYDDVFREPRQIESAGRQEGVDARVEGTAVDIPCQVEDQAWDQLRMARTGNDPQGEVVLVFHFQALELAGHVDATTGTAKVPRVGDRLASIHRSADLSLVQAVTTPLFCVEAQPRSHGLSGLERNLLVCTFRERARSSPKV